ncbi:MAG: hypothetical protein WCD02_03380 [Terriglobales bacterium]|jgi:hypothetical protein
MKYVLALVALLTAGFAFAQEPGSKLYIPPPQANQTLTDGTKVVTTTAPAFNVVLQAAIFKEKLPFQMVQDSAHADYVVQWAAIPEEGNSHGNGSLLFHSVSKELYTVSASLLSKDSQVVWAGSADKKNLHDAAEEITKQLKSTMKHKK